MIWFQQQSVLPQHKHKTGAPSVLRTGRRSDFQPRDAVTSNSVVAHGEPSLRSYRLHVCLWPTWCNCSYWPSSVIRGSSHALKRDEVTCSFSKSKIKCDCVQFRISILLLQTNFSIKSTRLSLLGLWKWFLHETKAWETFLMHWRPQVRHVGIFNCVIWNIFLKAKIHTQISYKKHVVDFFPRISLST